MGFSAADLTEVVTILEEVGTKTAAGGYDETWQALRKEHAYVRPLTGGERQAADRTEATAGYLVVIRARHDVTEKNKVQWDGREMNIRFAKKRGPRALFLELECDMGVAI